MRRGGFLATGAAFGVAAAAVPSFVRAAESLSVSVPGATLAGTLELPRTTSPAPVVLIIAGSGPTDRDGNSTLAGVTPASYKLLAQALAARGIASYRYDKRGIGASASGVLDERALTIDTYIDDAVAIVAKLQSDPRLDGVTIAGHSEGSLVGMVAAQRARLHGYVSIAGAGRPAEAILMEQLARPSSGVSADQLARIKTMFERIAAGETIADVPPGLMALFRPSVQPYMRSWLRLDPAREIAKVTVPTAIVQGQADLQVTEADARLLAAAAPKAKLVLVPRMSHTLKDTDGTTIPAQMSAYTDPAQPLDPTVATVVSAIAGGSA